MENGWIKVHREIMQDPDYLSEPFTRVMAWIDLNLLANHAPGFTRVRGVKVDIGRGQVVASRDWLVKRWRWSPGKVTRFLDELENGGRIVQQKTNVTNCISLVNYDIEQSGGTANNTADSTTNDAANDTADSTADDTANGRQTVQQTDTYKNNKKNKNEKNNAHTHGVESRDFSRAHEPAPATHTRARAMLDWLTETHPGMMAMSEPLDEATAEQLIAKYHWTDITRIFADMHNKGVEARNTNTLATFYAFAQRDTVLMARKAADKLITYDQLCDQISRGARQDDYEGISIDGRTMWRQRAENMTNNAN